MAASRKSLGFSIHLKQDEYIEEKLGYGIIDVIMALLAETMRDKKCRVRYLQGLRVLRQLM